MSKITAIDKPDEWVKTDAYKNLETNLKPLSGLLRLISGQLKHATTSLHRRFSRQIKRGPALNVNALQFAVSDLSREVDVFLKARGLTHAWVSVMLVTFTLAYLEEGLALLALKNPELLRDADALSYEVVFEAETIDDLRNEMRHQWAGKSLRGGPQAWFKLLNNMGARGYKKNLIFILTHLWDTRNQIVHGRGIANSVYVKRYPTLGLKRGDRIPLGGNILKWWLEGLGEFVDVTDRFLSKYASPTPRK